MKEAYIGLSSLDVFLELGNLAVDVVHALGNAPVKSVSCLPVPRHGRDLRLPFGHQLGKGILGTDGAALDRGILRERVRTRVDTLTRPEPDKAVVMIS